MVSVQYGLIRTIQVRNENVPGVMGELATTIGKAGAKNAAIFALEILGATDKNISAKLSAYKRRMRMKIKKIKLKI